jgi:hypothetical protein
MLGSTTYSLTRNNKRTVAWFVVQGGKVMPQFGLQQKMTAQNEAVLVLRQHRRPGNTGLLALGFAVHHTSRRFVQRAGAFMIGWIMATVKGWWAS